MNEIQVYEKKISQTLSVADQIMSMPKYRKMQKEEILAILQTSHSLGIDPFLALNKDLYAINGKIEMSSELMNRLIHKHGHTVQVKKLDNNECILIGRRRDTGGTMEASFSIQDAQLAGIYKNSWLRYPQDMLWARALSRLGRRLFPDVLCGCYVQGEISESISCGSMESSQIYNEKIVPITEIKEVVPAEKVRELAELMEPYEDIFNTVMKGLQDKYGIESLFDLPPSLYDKIKKFIEDQIKLKSE